LTDCLLTVKQTAEYLCVSSSTVYRYVKKNELVHYRKKFGLRFRRLDLDEWLERDRHKTFSIDSIFHESLTIVPPIVIDMTKGGSCKLAKKGQTCNYGYGSVYFRKTKTGEKRFYIYFYNAEGKRIRRVVPHAHSRDEAHEELKKEILEVIAEKQNHAEVEKKITLKEFAVVYRQYINANRSNFKSDIYRLEKLEEFFADIELQEITPMMIERFRTQRNVTGNSKATINRYMALLKRMFNLAIGEGYLEKNVVRKIRFYSEKDQIKDRTLSYEEEVALLNACSKQLKPIVIMALNTGMRKSEVLNLEWKNVDFTSRTIKVEKTKGKKVRYIPINTVLFEALQELKKDQKYSSRVFPFDNIRAEWENSIKNAKLNGQGITFHTLRHNFASCLIEQGVDVEIVRSLLGHSSLLVTQRYVHARDERKRNAVENLIRQTHYRHIERFRAIGISPNHLFSAN